jgi:hypothetical protein
LNVDDPSGVFQDELQLSDQPPLGDWKIEVIQGVSLTCFLRVKITNCKFAALFFNFKNDNNIS